MTGQSHQQKSRPKENAYLKLMCNYIYVHTETQAHTIITRKPESRDAFQIIRVRIHDKGYTIHNKDGVDE